MIHYVQTSRLTDVMMSLEMLKNLNDLYPGFHGWFVNKAMPGIILGDDILICAKEHDQIIGVALGKKRDDETKMRCIRVDPAYQKRGVGMRLIDGMLTALGDDKPHCTVAEEMMHDYSRAFIEHYRFTLTNVTKGEHRFGKLEYGFNVPKDLTPTTLVDFSVGREDDSDPLEMAHQKDVFSRVRQRPSVQTVTSETGVIFTSNGLEL
jgi:GNAT superfamily N-acetyltransferase